MGGRQEEQGKRGEGWPGRLKSLPSPLVMLPYSPESFSLPSTERDMPLPIKIFFINVSSPFKTAIRALFPALLPGLLFPRIITLPGRPSLEWPILLSPNLGSPRHAGHFQNEKCSGLK